ncbi:hypothetical protein BD779DRAFT_1535004 [Infundibulicybe gibba]|nr:hypothetical protein BD779DRAFT_1535004 [Infundibulicybe gibba]
MCTVPHQKPSMITKRQFLKNGPTRHAPFHKYRLHNTCTGSFTTIMDANPQIFQHSDEESEEGEDWGDKPPPSIRFRGPRRHTACEECDYEGGGACHNCIERGCANTCSDGARSHSSIGKVPKTSSPPSPGPFPRLESAPVPRLTPPAPTAPAPTRTRGHHFTVRLPQIGIPLTRADALSKLKRFTTLLRTLTRILYMAFFLGIPLYYYHQAEDVLMAFLKCDQEDRAWIASFGTHHGPSTDLLGEHRNNSVGPDQHSPAQIAIRNGALLPTLPQLPPPVPPSVRTLETVWKEYISQRLMEWKSISPIAVLLATFVVSLLQIEGANRDPLVRSLIFSTLCQAVSAAFAIAIIPLYFQRNANAGIHSSALWIADARNTEGSLWTPWIAIALPAVCIARTFAFGVAAVFAYFWLADTTITDGPPIIKPPVGFAMRLAITLLFVFDLAHIFIATRTIHMRKSPKPPAAGGLQILILNLPKKFK